MRVSIVEPPISTGASAGVHPKSEVSRAYTVRVLCPVIVAPFLAQFAYWVMERVDRPGSGLAVGLGAAVLAVAWVSVLIGTVVLGKRFGEDRRRSAHNGAKPWQTASILLLVLLPLTLIAVWFVIALMFAAIGNFGNSH